jgi:hypothetical protein
MCIVVTCGPDMLRRLTIEIKSMIDWMLVER